MQKIIFTKEIEQISMNDLVEYKVGIVQKLKIDDPRFFYIGDATDIIKIDDVEYINLKRFHIQPFLNYKLEIPELIDNIPYEFSPYNELLGKYNLFNSVLLFKDIDDLDFYMKIKYIFVNKYINILNKDRSSYWFYLQLNLENYKAAFEKELLANIPAELPENAKNEIKKYINYYNNDVLWQVEYTYLEEHVYKFHLQIKSIYIIYALEMIYRNFEKFCLPLEADFSRNPDTSPRPNTYLQENNIILPNTPFKSGFHEFKITPNYGFSYISDLYKKEMGGYLPVFVFYFVGVYATRFNVIHFIKIINEIFPNNVQELISYNFIPRFNIRINKILCIAFGNGDTKISNIKYYKEKGLQYPSHIPKEYKYQMNKCIENKDKESCLKKNKYSNYLTGTDICNFNDDTNECIGNPNILEENDVLPGRIESLDEFNSWINESPRYCSFMPRDHAKYKSTKLNKFINVIILEIFEYNKYGCQFVKVLVAYEYNKTLLSYPFKPYNIVVDAKKLIKVKKYLGGYHAKYIKYKNKYLNLKNQLK
jgi:hypothetical protein